MSQPEVYKQFKGIYATYQAVLNSSLGEVVEALNYGDPIGCFRAVKVLLLVSPPKVKHECLPDLRKIEDDILRANQTAISEGVDLKQRKVRRKRATLSILRAQTIPLFNKLMDQLHAEGYFEKFKTVRKGKFEG